MAPPSRAMAVVSVMSLMQLAAGKSAQLIQSADGTDDRLTPKGNIDFVPDFPFEGPTVSVLPRTDQEIIGFGGAFTEAAALVFQTMPESQQNQLLQMYWGQDGIGFTLGRSHINSCDFSPTYYTFDEVSGDYDLLHFDSNVTHDTESLIPFIKKAQALLHSRGEELKLLVAPWSPPGWMKTNGQMLGSPTPGLRDDSKATWAKYFSKWISAYKAHGIPIWAVTPENEPENDGIWESCVYTAESEMDFIGGHLGPVLKADHPDVQIFVFDHNKDHALDWAQALYAHPEASQYASGVAFHWYTGDEFESVAEIHRQYPKALLISSEATFDQSRLHGASVADGNWMFGMGYAHDIIGDLNAGSAAWIDWNLLLDMKGGPNKVGNECDAPMVSDGEHLFVHPQYYAIGHFSKYIPAGSKRLESSVSGSTRSGVAKRPYGSCDASDGLEATSFLRPDGLVTVVVLNCGDEKIDFKLQDGAVAVMATIPARGIQTYLLNRDEEVLVV